MNKASKISEQLIKIAQLALHKNNLELFLEVTSSYCDIAYRMNQFYTNSTINELITEAWETLWIKP